MSEAFADASALSSGTFGRPSNGMLREKRLADGFSEERRWLLSSDTAGGDGTGSDRAKGSLGTSSSMDMGVCGIGGAEGGLGEEDWRGGERVGDVNQDRLDGILTGSEGWEGADGWGSLEVVWICCGSGGVGGVTFNAGVSALG